MCELLGMSANTPTDLCFSFTGLTQRGGNTGPHKDGWGIAFYEGKGVRLFHDPEPSASSPLAQLVQNYPIKSEIAISHIRQANVGEINLANTHPFIREMWGQYWVFAHNGQIKDFKTRPGPYESVGDTDSEALFCDLLNFIHAEFNRHSDIKDIAQAIVELAAEYNRQGVFNCLLSNSDMLFTYCGTKLSSITRRAPFGAAQLKDADMTVDFSAVTTPNDVVSIIATEPLTSDETWHIYEKDEWRLWKEGEVIASGKAAASDAESSSA